MSNVIPLGKRGRKTSHNESQVIRKIIDGEVVEFLNFDALTPAERERLYSETERAEA